MRTLSVVALLLAALVAAVAWIVATPDDVEWASAPANGASTAAVAPGVDALDLDAKSQESSRDELALNEASDSAEADATSQRPRTRVCGRTIDERGVPIEGVRVLCALASRGPNTPIDSEDWKPSRRKLREAHSDAEGRFCVEGVEFGVSRIALRAVDHAPLDLEGVIVVDGETTDLGDLALTAGVRLSGVVVDARGVRAPDVWLIRPFDLEHPSLGREPGDRGVVLGQSDAEGAFDLRGLAVGPWTLLLYSPHYPEVAAHGATTIAGETVAGLVLRLPESATISGAVRIAPGPLAPRPESLEVVASALEDDPAAIGDARASRRSAAVLSDGAFRVEGLEPDRSYRLRVQVAEARHSLEAYAEADAGDSGVLLNVGSPMAVRVQLRDAESGKTIDDARVRAIAEHPDGRARTIESYTTKAEDGALLVLSDRSLNDGELLALSISRDDYVSSRTPPVRTRPNTVTDLGEVQLTPKARLRFHVVDPQGQPVAGAVVSLQITTDATGVKLPLDERSSRGGGSRVERSEPTDASGRTTLRGNAGECGVASARHSTYASSKVVEVCFDGASSEIELALLDGAGLRVAVRDPSGASLSSRSVRVDRKRDDASPSQESLRYWTITEATGADGVASFAALTPGPYVVRLDEPRAGAARDPRERDSIWAEVEVVDGEAQQVDLVALRRGRLTGRISSTRRALANAEVALSPGGRSSREGSGTIRVRTDVDGRYRVDDLGEGLWNVTVSHADFLSAKRVELDYRGDDRSFDVELPRDPVSGRVVDARGDPVADARIVVGWWRDVSKSKDRRAKEFQPLLGGAAAAVTESYGEFELIGLPRGRLAIEVRHPDFVVETTKPFVTAEGAPLALADIVLTRGGRVAVELEAPPLSGPRPRALLVRLDGPKDRFGKREFRSANLDRNGKARFHSVAAGKWRIELDPRISGAERLRREIRVEAGKAEVVRFASF